MSIKLLVLPERERAAQNLLISRRKRHIGAICPAHYIRRKAVVNQIFINIVLIRPSACPPAWHHVSVSIQGVNQVKAQIVHLQPVSPVLRPEINLASFDCLRQNFCLIIHNPRQPAPQTHRIRLLNMAQNLVHKFPVCRGVRHKLIRSYMDYRILIKCPVLNIFIKNRFDKRYNLRPRHIQMIHQGTP